MNWGSDGKSAGADALIVAGKVLAKRLNEKNSPDEVSARAYRIVSDMKRLETASVGLQVSYIDWVLAAENDEKNDSRLRGIEKWYTENMPEVTACYERISDYEIEQLLNTDCNMDEGSDDAGEATFVII